MKSIRNLVIDPSARKLYAGAAPGGVYVIQSEDIGRRMDSGFGRREGGPERQRAT